MLSVADMANKIPAQHERDRVDSLIRERFSSSFMSDSKWVRLLEVLVVLQPRVEFCKAKLVWDESLREMRIPESSSLGFDYYRNSMEAMISGSPRGFYLYKEVEWIELLVTEKNAEAVANQIRKAGEFELIPGETGLRIYAYR
jgi:hypothetical protein